MNLFAIYIGGSHEQSLIELHDMRFCVGHTIEDTYEDLKKSWWGKPETLHIDAWGVLSHVDGYAIHLQKEPDDQASHALFFVNLGGYDPGQFTELHKNIFVVAQSDREAKIQALKKIQEWHSPHRDNQFDVEHLINVNHILRDQKRYVHLRVTDQERPFIFTCKRIPLGKI